MNAIASAPRLDDIRCFLPGINDAEYEIRSKLRSIRNAATGMIGITGCPTARQLAWIANDWITDTIYAPADRAWLADVQKFGNRAMILSLQAQRMEMGGGEQ